jgi:hypothetical protein
MKTTRTCKISKRLHVGKALFALMALLFFCSGLAAQTPVHHYEYVFTSGFIYVYDIDNAGVLVKTVLVPTTAGVRGAVASVATGNLYIAYGPDQGSGGSQLAYDLATDQVVWTKTYTHGIDSQSISPDGTKIYMPSGELSSGGTWYVEDSATGSDIATIVTSGNGPHNTIVNASGTRVYLGSRDYNLGSGSQGVKDFNIASLATDQVTGSVTPTQSGVRPFTINSTETLAYLSVTSFLGFQVGDLSSGKVLYTVPIDGSGIPGFTTSSSVTDPSHGIALSADDNTLYVIDQPNNHVHVFDVSGLPASAPVQVANIKLTDGLSANQLQCAYDCGGSGWLHLSHDGNFLFVGDTPDVINTSTRALAMRMPEMANSRVEIEIDFQGTTPIWAMGSRSSTGITGGPPAPLAIASLTLPGGVVGTAYSQIVSPTGGTPPYTCSSSPVDGLTANANCTITGTPLTGQTVSLAVTVTDSASPPAKAAGTERVTITAAPPPPPVHIAVSPSTASVAVSTTRQFTATVKNATNTTVTWTTTIGTISAAGLFTAPASTGAGTVTATSQADPTKSASSSVTVTAAALYPYAPYFLAGPMTFNFTQGGTSPAGKTTGVSNTSPCPPPSGVPTCHWLTSMTTDQPWLSVTPSSGTTTFTVTVSVKTTGLAPGTYTGNVIATIPQESGSPAKLSVTLKVTARHRHR